MYTCMVHRQFLHSTWTFPLQLKHFLAILILSWSWLWSNDDFLNTYFNTKHVCSTQTQINKFLCIQFLENWHEKYLSYKVQSHESHLCDMRGWLNILTDWVLLSFWQRLFFAKLNKKCSNESKPTWLNIVSYM